MATPAAAASLVRASPLRLISLSVRPSPTPPIPRLLRAPRLSPTPSPPSRSLRKAALALGSMMPAHSALASARLVAKLSKEPSASVQGRFANYLSPI